MTVSDPMPNTVLHTLTIDHDGRRVPCNLWLRRGSQAARPLVLVGHGGSQHKGSDAVLDVVRGLVDEPATADAWNVAAIDGPIHGARRSDGGLDGPKVVAEFRELWANHPEAIDTMVGDWQAAIDSLSQRPEVDASAIGWFGLSMGTAYGLPLCAAEARIRAAVLGMWGTSHPQGERLLQAARQLACPVRFHRKRDDERFSVAGQVALFEAIASPVKEHVVYEGRHVNPGAAELGDAFKFFRSTLAA